MGSFGGIRVEHGVGGERRMKVIPLVLVVLFLAFAVAPAYAPPSPRYSPSVKVADLIAEGGPTGIHLDVGDVYVKTRYDGAYMSAPDRRYLIIDITTAAGWTLTAVYIDVESNPSEFPTNKLGNPKPGQFWINLVGINTNTFSMLSNSIIVSLGADITRYIAIHARVYNAETATSEGAWAEGLSGDMTGNGQFSGSSWATYVRFDSLHVLWWIGDD